MKKALREILGNLSISETIGSLDGEVEKIVFDSRQAEEKTIFVATVGTHTDGHRFIDNAIQAGAKIIVCESFPEKLQDAVTYIKVGNSAEALGQMAAGFYDNPSRKLTLIGVTGTNGKTTVATLLFNLHRELGYKTGLLSTVENRIGDRVIPARLTTPDAIALNQLLAEMVEAGCEYVFMEVSSHAIHQARIAGLHFAGGIFTNISHDHLDYHKTFRAYLNTKKRFFDELPKTAFTLVNVDDKNGEVMVQNTTAKKYTYGLKKMAKYKARIIENNLTGLHLDINGIEFFCRLIGQFNAYNILAVYGAASILEHNEMELLTALSNLQTAEGRFETIKHTKKKILGIVDYAHTPDALENVLRTIERMNRGAGRVITVVGCGGDRDKKKRPIMAKTACDYSQQVILTSDNPRTEDPNVIIAEMEAGVPAYAQSKVLIIENRLQAIRTACRLAKEDDIILVAGKGHEKYQEINGTQHPFDDKEILKAEFHLT